MDFVPYLPGVFETHPETGETITVKPPRPCPFLLTQSEAAEFLRLPQLQHKKVYEALLRYRTTAGLQAVKIGNDVRYPLGNLMEWIEGRTKTGT